MKSDWSYYLFCAAFWFFMFMIAANFLIDLLGAT